MYIVWKTTCSTTEGSGACSVNYKKTNTYIHTYTDSRVALDSIGNPNKHSFLVEEIRKKAASLEESEWRIQFSWVKAHARTLGNKVADMLTHSLPAI